MQGGGGRVRGGEEEFREDQNGGGGVDVEVEKLDGGADEACEQHASGGIGRRR